MDRMAVFNDRLRTHDVTHVDTAADAIQQLKKNEFELVFLDHDLGGEMFVSTADTNTGSEVVRWMVSPEYEKHSPVVIVHSHNEPAAVSMEHALAYAGLEVHRIDFRTLVSQHFSNPDFLT